MMKIYNVGVEDLSDYDIKDMDGESLDFVVYWYESGSYEGDGEAVGYSKEENVLYVKGLGHCSCYGPMDGGIKSGVKVTPFDFFSHKENVHSLDTKDCIKDKVKELLPEYTPVFSEKFDFLKDLM
jgi:hypothetical protein